MKQMISDLFFIGFVEFSEVIRCCVFHKGRIQIYLKAAEDTIYYSEYKDILILFGPVR